MKVVVALFPDFQSAANAIKDLNASDIDREDISLIASTRSSENRREESSSGPGPVIGGIGGLLVGTGALSIPGIGPIIAGGPVAGSLSGHSYGSPNTPLLVGQLKNFGISEKASNVYAEGVRQGLPLVIVKVEDDQSQQVMDTLNQFGTMDPGKLEKMWREVGWESFAARLPGEPDLPLPGEEKEKPKGTVERPKGTIERPKGTVESPKGTVENRNDRFVVRGDNQQRINRANDENEVQSGMGHYGRGKTRSDDEIQSGTGKMGSGKTRSDDNEEQSSGRIRG